MQTILSNKKSSVGSPYVFYTVGAEEISGSRTPTSVQLKIQVQAHLQYSQSSLGTGWYLNGYIKVNNVEHSITIKSSSASWSGTTVHTVSTTFTVDNISSSATSLTGITFRVAQKNNDSGYLPATACSDITITMGHIAPTNVEYQSIAENRISGIAGDYFVENLSSKTITLRTPVLYDGATIAEQGVMNGTTKIQFSGSSKTIDLQSYTFEKANNKIPLQAYVIDSLGSSTYGPVHEFSYTTYTKPTLSANAKRDGQLTGKAILSISGVFFNQLSQASSYKPTVKYRVWEYGTTEPSSWTTISASSINVNGSNYSTSLNIGSTDPSSSSYKDPDKAYRVRVVVNDTWSGNVLSPELVISKGEPVWTEYRDRVDFARISSKNVNLGTNEFESAFTPAGSISAGAWKLATNELSVTLTGGMYLIMFNITSSVGASSSSGQVTYNPAIDGTRLSTWSRCTVPLYPSLGSTANWCIRRTLNANQTYTFSIYGYSSTTTSIADANIYIVKLNS